MELARNLHLAAASPPPATGTPRPRPPLAFNPFGTRQRSRLRFAALAAVLVVAAAGGAGVWLARGGAKGVPRATLRATLALRTISTPSGQRATVRLADGSRVVLAPASRLTYGERFGTGRDRTVDLVGEGYFDVIHDARRPFRVRTAHAITQDVGTAFVVRAYVGDRTERVAVEEGRVRVRARLDTAGLHAAHLTHGRAATVSVAGDPTPRVGTADPRTDFSWVRDTLVFNATPASDVAAAIGRWYDVDVVLADTAMRARQLTLSLSDETTDQALGVLAALLHARVVRQGRLASLVSR
jgi:ferric-dicitrate binding protein FerR (iron transport regulator)